MHMKSDARRRAVAKYQKRNIITKVVKLNRKTDSDILRYLEQIDNFQGFVKKLIREKIDESHFN